MKLYYEDCHLKTFTARVESCESTPKGYAVTLSETAFYPEGGGQACDLGTLADTRVLDVREVEDRVVHYCADPLTPGQTVQGTIDYERRFDLMQQHTGEHMVSGLIYSRYGYHNVGFHMGREVTTIDFDGIIPQEDLPELENQVNRLIWENLPVRCYVPSPQELEALSYRTKRPLPWPVRIVEVPGVDRCACCGVHVAFTGEVGLVKLFTAVKFHQGTRIEMACGGKALSLLQLYEQQNRLVSQALSAKPQETGAAAQRICQQLAQEKFRSVSLQRRIFEITAAGYRGQQLGLVFEAGLEPGQLRELAAAIGAVCPLAAVFSGAEEDFGFCLAGEPDRVRAVSGAMKEGLSCRGGGKPGFFQGRVQAPEDRLRDFFAKITNIFP